MIAYVAFLASLFSFASADIVWGNLPSGQDNEVYILGRLATVHVCHASYAISSPYNLTLTLSRIQSMSLHPLDIPLHIEFKQVKAFQKKHQSGLPEYCWIIYANLPEPIIAYPSSHSYFTLVYRDYKNRTIQTQSPFFGAVDIKTIRKSVYPFFYPVPQDYDEDYKDLETEEVFGPENNEREACPDLSPFDKKKVTSLLRTRRSTAQPMAKSKGDFKVRHRVRFNLKDNQVKEYEKDAVTVLQNENDDELYDYLADEEAGADGDVYSQPRAPYSYDDDTVDADEYLNYLPSDEGSNSIDEMVPQHTSSAPLVEKYGAYEPAFQRALDELLE